MRHIHKIALPQLTPNTPPTEGPKFAMVDPSMLLVDESYQRAFSKRSILLIRRMVAGWDWRKFKPPVVARTASGLEVLDGQHTAMAAACHPLIDTIPVMIVPADRREDRAAAFVGHNRDRLGLTPMQMHFGAVAAGDQDAIAINEACSAAGVTVLKMSRSDGYQPGETVAVTVLAALVKRRGAQGAVEVLRILVEAKCAPVSANWIKAMDLLVHDDEYQGVLDAGDLSRLVAASRADLETEAAMFAGAHGVVTWKALAVVTYRKCRKRRRS